MGHVAFLPDTHTYLNVESKAKYTSVTTIISKYKQKFDAKVEAEAYLMRHPSVVSLGGAQDLVDKFDLDIEPQQLLDEGITAEKIAEIWQGYSEQATHEGTKYHYLQEIDALYNHEKNLSLAYDYNDHVKTLKDLPDGVYPELRVWYDPYMIAGTIDKVTIKKPYIWIEDYKTNKKLMSKENTYKKWMKSPLQFLPDTDYYHYQTQLNIYGWILEQYGYIVKELKIIQKRFADDKPIPQRFWIPFISETVQRRPVIYPMEYYPERMNMFLGYDNMARQGVS